MNETRIMQRKRILKRRRRKRVAAITLTLILTCFIVLCFSFDLDDGFIAGTRISTAQAVVDSSPVAEIMRDERVSNYHVYLAALEKQARVAAAKAEVERLEQERLEQERLAEEKAEHERLAAELATWQEKIARNQIIKDFVISIAKGEVTSDAMSGVMFRRNKELKGKVALSFDDGPFKTYTYKYVDILEEYGAHASFFCQAQNVKRYPEQTQNIIDTGNELGLHSYAHADLTKMTDSTLEAELKRCLEIMSPYQDIYYFRPPYGAYNTRINDFFKKNNLISVMWSVDPQDWATDEVDKIVNHVLEKTKDGDIILLHEGRDNTLQALPKILSGLKEKGFEIVTVSELLYGDQGTEVTKNE